MPIALLETKLYVPRSRGDLVLRPRLSERLNRGTASKLVLVSAPAGFGKSTLLTEWLSARSAARADEQLAAWLSLDQGDNDPASFWAYVIAALRMAVSGVGESALALLHAPQPPPIQTVLTMLLNDLSAVAGEMVLVLDDYHVIDSRAVQDGRTFLLDHLPPRLHVVIASRADPALPLARMRARGELAEIRAAELRFTADEAATYLNEMMGLRLTARDVAALEERTEGRTGRIIEILVLRALADQALGDLPAALGFLDRAMTLAEPEGYVRIFADEGASMAALLRAAAKQGPRPDYARRLLAAASGTARHGAAEQALIEPLSERELDVLRLLGSELDGPAIARELMVSLNTMRTHTKNIYAKLAVTNRRAAVRRAAELNLLPRTQHPRP